MTILNTIPSFQNPTPNIIFTFSKDKKLAKLFFRLQRFPGAIASSTFLPTINFLQQEAIELWDCYKTHALKEHFDIFQFFIDLNLIHNSILSIPSEINLNNASQKIVQSIATIITFTNAIIYFSHEPQICIYTLNRLVEECNNFPNLGIAIKKYYEIAQFIIKRESTQPSTAQSRSTEVFNITLETNPSSISSISEDSSTSIEDIDLLSSISSVPDLLPEIEFDPCIDFANPDLELDSIFN